MWADIQAEQFVVAGDVVRQCEALAAQYEDIIVNADEWIPDEETLCAEGQHVRTVSKAQRIAGMARLIVRQEKRLRAIERKERATVQTLRRLAAQRRAIKAYTVSIAEQMEQCIAEYADGKTRV